MAVDEAFIASSVSAGQLFLWSIRLGVCLVRNKVFNFKVRY
jgi:hypothetical protein